jgi:hypothetical protein
MEKMILTKILVGTFNLPDGNIVVSDPLFRNGNGFNHELKIKSGIYAAHVVSMEHQPWGERIVQLTITHESVPGAVPKTIIGMCAVETGQCGFFEKKDYEKNHPDTDSEVEEASKWYDRACRITLDRGLHFAGMMTSEGKVVGVVSSSGFGDGQYRLFACYNEKDEIVALRLRFIP